MSLEPLEVGWGLQTLPSLRVVSLVSLVVHSLPYA